VSDYCETERNANDAADIRLSFGGAELRPISAPASSPIQHASRYQRARIDAPAGTSSR